MANFAAACLFIFTLTGMEGKEDEEPIEVEIEMELPEEGEAEEAEYERLRGIEDKWLGLFWLLAVAAIAAALLGHLLLCYALFAACVVPFVAGLYYLCKVQSRWGWPHWW